MSMLLCEAWWNAVSFRQDTEGAQAGGDLKPSEYLWGIPGLTYVRHTGAKYLPAPKLLAPVCLVCFFEPGRQSAKIISNNPVWCFSHLFRSVQLAPQENEPKQKKVRTEQSSGASRECELPWVQKDIAFLDDRPCWPCWSLYPYTTGAFLLLFWAYFSIRFGSVALLGSPQLCLAKALGARFAFFLSAAFDSGTYLASRSQATSPTSQVVSQILEAGQRHTEGEESLAEALSTPRNYSAQEVRLPSWQNHDLGLPVWSKQRHQTCLVLGMRHPLQPVQMDYLTTWTLGASQQEDPEDRQRRKRSLETFYPEQPSAIDAMVDEYTHDEDPIYGIRCGIYLQCQRERAKGGGTNGCQARGKGEGTQLHTSLNRAGYEQSVRSDSESSWRFLYTGNEGSIGEDGGDSSKTKAYSLPSFQSGESEEGKDDPERENRVSRCRVEEISKARRGQSQHAEDQLPGTEGNLGESVQGKADPLPTASDGDAADGPELEARPGSCGFGEGHKLYPRSHSRSGLFGRGFGRSGAYGSQKGQNGNDSLRRTNDEWSLDLAPLLKACLDGDDPIRYNNSYYQDLNGYGFNHTAGTKLVSFVGGRDLHSWSFENEENLVKFDYKNDEKGMIYFAGVGCLYLLLSYFPRARFFDDELMAFVLGVSALLLFLWAGLLSFDGLCWFHERWQNTWKATCRKRMVSVCRKRCSQKRPCKRVKWEANKIFLHYLIFWHFSLPLVPGLPDNPSGDWDQSVKDEVNWDAWKTTNIYRYENAGVGTRTSIFDFEPRADVLTRSHRLRSLDEYWVLTRSPFSAGPNTDDPKDDGSSLAGPGAQLCGNCLARADVLTRSHRFGSLADQWMLTRSSFGGNLWPYALFWDNDRGKGIDLFSRADVLTRSHRFRSLADHWMLTRSSSGSNIRPYAPCCDIDKGKGIDFFSRADVLTRSHRFRSLEDLWIEMNTMTDIKPNTAQQEEDYDEMGMMQTDLAEPEGNSFLDTWLLGYCYDIPEPIKVKRDNSGTISPEADLTKRYEQLQRPTARDDARIAKIFPQPSDIIRAQAEAFALATEQNIELGKRLILLDTTREGQNSGGRASHWDDETHREAQIVDHQLTRQTFLMQIGLAVVCLHPHKLCTISIRGRFWREEHEWATILDGDYCTVSIRNRPLSKAPSLPDETCEMSGQQATHTRQHHDNACCDDGSERTDAASGFDLDTHGVEGEYTAFMQRMWTPKLANRWPESLCQEVDARLADSKMRSLIVWKHSFWAMNEPRSLRKTDWLKKTPERWDEIRAGFDRTLEKSISCAMISPDPPDQVIRRPNLVFTDFWFSDVYPTLVDFTNEDITSRFTLITQMQGSTALTEQIFSKLEEGHNCGQCQACYVETPNRYDWPSEVPLHRGQYFKATRTCRIYRGNESNFAVSDVSSITTSAGSMSRANSEDSGEMCSGDNYEPDDEQTTLGLDLGPHDEHNDATSLMQNQGGVSHDEEPDGGRTDVVTQDQYDQPLWILAFVYGWDRPLKVWYTELGRYEVTTFLAAQVTAQDSTITSRWDLSVGQIRPQPTDVSSSRARAYYVIKLSDIRVPRTPILVDEFWENLADIIAWGSRYSPPLTRKLRVVQAWLTRRDFLVQMGLEEFCEGSEQECRIMVAGILWPKSDTKIKNLPEGTHAQVFILAPQERYVASCHGGKAGKGQTLGPSGYLGSEGQTAAHQLDDLSAFFQLEFQDTQERMEELQHRDRQRNREEIMRMTSIDDPRQLMEELRTKSRNAPRRRIQLAAHGLRFYRCQMKVKSIEMRGTFDHIDILLKLRDLWFHQVDSNDRIENYMVYEQPLPVHMKGADFVHVISDLKPALGGIPILVLIHSIYYDGHETCRPEDFLWGPTCHDTHNGGMLGGSMVSMLSRTSWLASWCYSRSCPRNEVRHWSWILTWSLWGIWHWARRRSDGPHYLSWCLSQQIPRQFQGDGTPIGERNTIIMVDVELFTSLDLLQSSSSRPLREWREVAIVERRTTFARLIRTLELEEHCTGEGATCQIYQNGEFWNEDPFDERILDNGDFLIVRARPRDDHPMMCQLNNGLGRVVSNSSQEDESDPMWEEEQEEHHDGVELLQLSSVWNSQTPKGRPSVANHALRRLSPPGNGPRRVSFLSLIEDDEGGKYRDRSIDNQFIEGILCHDKGEGGNSFMDSLRYGLRCDPKDSEDEQEGEAASQMPSGEERQESMPQGFLPILSEQGVEFADVFKVHDWISHHQCLPNYDLLALPWKSCSRSWLDCPIGLAPIQGEWHFYMDGSRTVGGSGSGCIAYFFDGWQWLFGGWLGIQFKAADSYEAEVNATTLAAKWAWDLIKYQPLGNYTDLKVIFHFDNMAAGEAATGHFGSCRKLPGRHLTRAILQLLRAGYGVDVQGIHQPSHVGEPGNEMADVVASYCSMNQQPDDTFWQRTLTETNSALAEWFWLFYRMDLFPFWRGTRLYIAKPVAETDKRVLADAQPLEDKAMTPIPGKLYVTIASYNPMSLKNMKGKKAGMFGLTESLLRQFAEQKVHIFSLQETRLKKKMSSLNPHFFLFQGNATAQGNGGTMMGFAKQRPIGTLDGKEIYFKEDDFKIIEMNEDVLIVKVHNKLLKAVCVNVHCPHSGNPDETIKTWWYQLQQRLRPLQSQGELIFMGDVNGRLGEVCTTAIGGLRPDAETLSGTLFHEFLLHGNLWCPSTFSEHHWGRTSTWTSPQGQESRIDYIAVHEKWKSSQVTSSALDEVIARDFVHDHCAIQVTLEGTVYVTETEKGKKYNPRRKVQGNDDICRLRETLKEIPTMSWTLDVHRHAELLHRHVKKRVQRDLGDSKKFILKSFIREDTWALIRQKQQMRKNYFALGSSCNWTRLRACFNGWAGNRQDTLDEDDLRPLQREMAINLHSFRKYPIKYRLC